MENQDSPGRRSGKDDIVELPFSWRSKLVKFYEEQDPSKVSNVDNILSKYSGREIWLFDFLHKKYEVGPSATPSVLNFYSSSFDPLLALGAPKIALPYSNARPLDNLHKTRNLVISVSLELQN